MDPIRFFENPYRGWQFTNTGEPIGAKEKRGGDSRRIGTYHSGCAGRSKERPDHFVWEAPVLKEFFFSWYLCISLFNCLVLMPASAADALILPLFRNRSCFR